MNDPRALPSPGQCLDIPPQPGPERDQKAWLFLNVNKFTARLMLTLEPVFNYEMFALWTMRAALETPTEQATFSRECPEVFVPAAAAWILILGPQIYQWDKEFDHGPVVGAPGRGGPLWAGKHGFCVERWSVWRSRFEEMAGSPGVFTAEVRASAGQAATRMRQVEAGEA
ncbi:hypothetical protein B0A55_04116 [Friedmanniomyces simplex]|uniref:Uncharacterized protein n=1 Tax=Friedmanniomyces simplex TaxID=329884 RepID=A0A4U0XJ07_9PEZI|nr:hypothetical protein B0A55_04116 [Friedmanniomyces simplex]